MKYALAYNEFHNLESIGIEGKNEKLIKYAYKNGNGRLKQMTYANGHTMKAVYNSIGQMVAEKWFETEAEAASSTATPIEHYKYVYDGDGNIVRSIDILSNKEPRGDCTVSRYTVHTTSAAPSASMRIS